MTDYKTELLQQDLQDARERLALYLAKERDILTGGVQAYGIGNRNLTRYNADLSSCRESIKALKKEIAELVARLNGAGPRRSVRVVPQDW